MKTVKDWDTILEGMSSGEESDGDVPNVLAVQKHARRAVELMHACVPGLSPEYCASLPMGMNNADVIRDGLKHILGVRETLLL